jgi:hypothetical protein
MQQSPDISPEFRKSLANIDYTSPVCKINVAINKLVYQNLIFNNWFTYDFQHFVCENSIMYP